MGSLLSGHLLNANSRLPFIVNISIMSIVLVFLLVQRTTEKK